MNNSVMRVLRRRRIERAERKGYQKAMTSELALAIQTKALADCPRLSWVISDYATFEDFEALCCSNTVALHYYAPDSELREVADVIALSDIAREHNVTTEDAYAIARNVSLSNVVGHTLYSSGFKGFIQMFAAGQYGVLPYYNENTLRRRYFHGLAREVVRVLKMHVKKYGGEVS